jgi:two-component system sensor histidine kinase KdpD
VLLSSVSHDLRTPLAVIKGAVTNLLDETVKWDSEARAELLGAINQETDRLNRLVGNLLNMSRIEAGTIQPHRIWHDISELISDVINRMQPMLPEHHLAADILSELPPVQLDYTLIEQVLTNLLENAGKYTPAGTPITITASREGDQLRVTVQDRGPGIPEGMDKRIFEKFVRSTEPERHADGTGLGLAICKGIIEAHGGRIWVESAPSGGAAFRFTLPLVPFAQSITAGTDAEYSQV